MTIYVHEPSNTYDCTAIQIHADDGTVTEISNIGGAWEVEEPEPLDKQDTSHILSHPFWKQVPI